MFVAFAPEGLAFGKAASISVGMKRLTFAFAALAFWGAGAALAQDTSVLDRWDADRTQIFDGSEITLSELQWLARPLVVFADTPNDPRFRQQLDLLETAMDDLAVRDVIIVTDTSPAEPSELRTALRPRGYMMALVGKDGRVALRKPSPWSVRELSRSIDKMPLRQQEIEDRRLTQ